MGNVARTVLSMILAGAAFLVLFLALHWPLLLCAALAVGLYLALDLLLRPRRRIGGIDVEELKGGEELRQLLDEAGADLETIRSAAADIQDPRIYRIRQCAGMRTRCTRPAAGWSPTWRSIRRRLLWPGAFLPTTWTRQQPFSPSVGSCRKPGFTRRR